MPGYTRTKNHFKVHAKYAPIFDKLTTNEIVPIHGYNAYGHIKRAIKAFNKDAFNCCPIFHNVFAISHKGKIPKRTFINEKVAIYEMSWP